MGIKMDSYRSSDDLDLENIFLCIVAERVMINDKTSFLQTYAQKISFVYNTLSQSGSVKLKQQS